MTDTVKIALVSGSKKAGSVNVPADQFDAPVNIPLIHQVANAQMAAARQGTHATKTRSEVSGGGKKPWRQKGTGRARQGSRRAPQWTGGGVVHGPQPRSYAQRTNKKMIAAALRAVLSDRTREGRLFAIESLISGDAPSTKEAVTALAAIGEYRSALVVLARDEDLAWLSLRNVAYVHPIAVDQLNVYDVLAHDAVVFSKSALDAYVARVSGAVSEIADDEDEAPAAPVEKKAEKKADKADKAEAKAKAEKPAAVKKPEKVESVKKGPAEVATPASASTPVEIVVEPAEEPVVVDEAVVEAEPEEKKPAKKAAEPVAKKLADPVEKKEPAKKAEEPADEDKKDYGPGSFRGDTPPEGYDIKGNEDSMKFHTPDSPWYSRTIAEVWFNSVDAAEAAGFVSVTGDTGAEDEEEAK
jgi:large subunit ribosomal protein L4